MRLVSRLEDFKPDPDRPLILGLGNFDGLHRGHQALLKRMREHAARQKGTPAVFTFQEHPQRVLHPGGYPPLLTSNEHKLFLFHEYGIRLCFLIPFTLKFSSLSAEAFTQKILVNQLRVRRVFLGHNAYFGHHREGDAVRMREFADRFGFEFAQVRGVKVAGDFVSSSRIRKYIQEGDLAQAGRCLGRRFSCLGKVVKGRGRGMGLRFPTANLEIQGEVLPPEGVYSVKVREVTTSLRATEGSEAISKPEIAAPARKNGGLAMKATTHFSATAGPWFNGVLNYGRRPTFGERTQKPILEVHLLDFKGDLYAKTLEAAFYPRLREEKAFNDPASLKKQIGMDIDATRRYFARLPR